MPEGSTYLLALEMLSKGDWLDRAEVILRHAGESLFRDARKILVLGNEQQHRGIAFCQGCRVQRIWLAPGRGAIGVFPRRLYFSGDGDEIDNRPEWKIVGDDRLPLPDGSAQLQVPWKIFRILVDGFGSEGRPVELQPLSCDPSNARSVWIGSKDLSNSRQKLNELYKAHGFDRVPSNFTISICPLESTSNKVIDEFAQRFSSAYARRKTAVQIRRSSCDEIRARVKKIKVSGEKASTGYCVLFILPRKKSPLNQESIELLGSLEGLGVPFRRAYADDPLGYSISDQLASLLIAAGGRPHRSQTVLRTRPLWTIGVDLSHRRNQDRSKLVLTLVSPDGELVGAWMTIQPRDETVRSNAIIGLLKGCRERLHSFGAHPEVIVLRDGRFFENEDGRLYSDILEVDLSLFEYRKGNNPQLVRHSTAQELITKPMAAILPGSKTIFIITSPPHTHNALPHVSKLTWRSDWNGLDLEPEQIASVLFASISAPSLGLRPQFKPASIYWADGIAGRDDADLRFRGIPVHLVTS